MVDHPNVLNMSEESVSWGAFRMIRAARFLKFLEIFLSYYLMWYPMDFSHSQLMEEYTLIGHFWSSFEIYVASIIVKI